MEFEAILLEPGQSDVYGNVEFPEDVLREMAVRVGDVDVKISNPEGGVGSGEAVGSITSTRYEDDKGLMATVAIEDAVMEDRIRNGMVDITPVMVVQRGDSTEVEDARLETAEIVNETSNPGFQL